MPPRTAAAPNKEQLPSQQQSAQEFLLKSRQVDAMINALHYNSDSLRHGHKQKEHHQRVGVQAAPQDAPLANRGQKAELARGLQEDPSDGINPTGQLPPALRTLLSPKSPARGVVPGLPIQRTRPLEERGSVALEASADRQAVEPTSARGTRGSIEVEPPWGPKRANVDRPPWEQVQRRQKQYRKKLDEQVDENEERRRRNLEEEEHLEKSTFTSLESKNHRWGDEVPDASRERALFQELVGTVNSRQRRDREREHIERKAHRRWAEEAEIKMAWHYQTKMEEGKQEKARMADQWMSAAKERQRKQEAEKREALQAEKEQINRIVQGMVPPRRLRRAMEDCAHSVR